MRNNLYALPVVADGQLGLDGCVASTIVHEGPSIQIIHWHCMHDGDALRAERSHTAFVLSLVQTGACRVHDGPWSATVDPATALLHRPGAAYRTTHPFGVHDSGWSIALDESVVYDEFDRIGLRPDAWLRPSFTTTTRPALVALKQFVLVRRRLQGYFVDPIAIEELCIELLQQLLAPMYRRVEDTTSRATRLEHSRLVEQTCEFLNTHYREVLQLDNIAQVVGASPFHLCRVFKRQTGMAIRSYLKRLRLGGVLQALAAGDDTLSRIAVDNGFYSHSHLTSVFSKELGCPPSEVRRLLAVSGALELPQSRLFDAARPQ